MFTICGAHNFLHLIDFTPWGFCKLSSLLKRYLQL